MQKSEDGKQELVTNAMCCLITLYVCHQERKRRDREAKKTLRKSEQLEG